MHIKILTGVGEKGEQDLIDSKKSFITVLRLNVRMHAFFMKCCSEDNFLMCLKSKKRLDVVRKKDDKK